MVVCGRTWEAENTIILSFSEFQELTVGRISRESKGENDLKLDMHAAHHECKSCVESGPLKQSVNGDTSPPVGRH